MVERLKTKLPFVSVLIVTRNNVRELLLCVESLRDLTYPKNRMELLVFDNGSTDGTAERVQELYEHLQGDGWARLALAQSPRNLGAFGGRAEAMRALSPATEFVLSLDDDVEVASDVLATFVQAMADAQVGVVGARIVYHDAPNEIASGAGYFNHWLGTYHEQSPATRTPCDFVTSCGCLIRRTALDTVEGFDRDYFTSHGDVDLCLKIRARGYTICYEPAALIRHKVARGGTRNPERVYYVYRNKLLLLRKHMSWWWRPVIFILYSVVWLPKVFADSVMHHRGVHQTEVRAILHAIVDAVADRRGEARWFRSH